MEVEIAPPLLDEFQLARAMSLSAREVKQAAKEGKIPCYLLGKRFRFKLEEVLTHCKRQPSEQ